MLNSLLNLIVGVLGLVVLFSQVKTLNGWTFASTLALLGVYLTISALRGWFIGPSLETLAGIEGDVWSGRFDFTLLRPINTQFFVSVRQWSWFAVIDLTLGLGVIVVATVRSGSASIFPFLVAAAASVAVLYAILLIFTALVFWSPGLLFTWVFDAIMQLARYPIGIYPGWLQFVLTWIIPVAIMTTIPAAALTGDQRTYIEKVGFFYEAYGLPRTVGRILGLLMIVNEPLSAEEIASVLNVSRASLSTNFRVLSAAGLAERYTSHKDRTTYYVFPDTAWEQAMILGARRAESFKRIIHEGLAAMPEKDAARSHLLRGSEYAELVIEFFERQIEEWRTHHRVR